jgi:hypothetical protein
MVISICKPDQPAIFFTRHAETRKHQRGVRSKVIELILDNFDADADAGEGVVALSVSRKRCHELHGKVPDLGALDQAKRTVLLVAADGAVVSVINRSNWFGRFHRGAERLGHRRRLARRGRIGR